MAEKDRYTVKLNGQIVGNGLTIGDAVKTCEFYLQIQSAKKKDIVINIEKERKEDADKITT